MEQNETKRTWSFFLPENLILKLKEYRKKTGVNVSFFVTEAIKERLAKVEGVKE
jgi:predicted DNA-binding protein